MNFPITFMLSFFSTIALATFAETNVSTSSSNYLPDDSEKPTIETLNNMTLDMPSTTATTTTSPTLLATMILDEVTISTTLESSISLPTNVESSESMQHPYTSLIPSSTETYQEEILGNNDDEQSLQAYSSLIFFGIALALLLLVVGLYFLWQYKRKRTSNVYDQLSSEFQNARFELLESSTGLYNPLTQNDDSDDDDSDYSRGRSELNASLENEFHF